jgi:hypothetical protein
VTLVAGGVFIDVRAKQEESAGLGEVGGEIVAADVAQEVDRAVATENFV